MIFTRSLGTYNNKQEVWKAYPSGGASGDYVQIDGMIYGWSTTSNDWVPALSENTSQSARSSKVVTGDMDVYNNLHVGGILSARVIRGRNAFCGLYADATSLNLHCANPLVGQWALTLIENRTAQDTALGEVWICEEDGTWTDAEFTCTYAEFVEQMASEAQARQTADEALQGNIDAEAEARENADTSLGEQIGAEAEARENADTSLGEQIGAEAEARENADTALQNAINAEKTARENADTALQNAINSIKANIDNGYVYAGTANLLTVPKSGKVFYFAMERGRYVNFGNIYIPDGINILKKVGSNWVSEFIFNSDELRREINEFEESVRELLKDYKPIEIHGDVTNAPDEEDLTTTSDNLLKLKDNEYNPLMFSGLGRKILRKNIVAESDYVSFDGFVEDVTNEGTLDGTPDYIYWDRINEFFVGKKDDVYYSAWTDDGDFVPTKNRLFYMFEDIPYLWNGIDLYVSDYGPYTPRNILTQEMLSEENTIYIIHYDFDLNGESITIPTGCTLKFDGGSLSNGTIVCQETIIVFNQDEDDILKDINLEGDFEYSSGGITKKDNINGMATITLRKNKSFAEQVTQGNTIYIIQHIFDLGGETIHVPNTSVLWFDGGSLVNGEIYALKIFGNDATIHVPVYVKDITGVQNHDAEIRDLTIDLQNDYDKGLIIPDNSIVYGRFENITVKNFNKVGIFAGANNFELFFSHIQTDSPHTNSTYRYNAGIEWHCSDSTIECAVLKNSWYGMLVYAQGIFDDIHIWGSVQNKGTTETPVWDFSTATHVGMLVHATKLIMKKICFDGPFPYDASKSPFYLVDANDPLSYNGGCGILVSGFIQGHATEIKLIDGWKATGTDLKIVNGDGSEPITDRLSYNNFYFVAVNADNKLSITVDKLCYPLNANAGLMNTFLWYKGNNKYIYSEDLCGQFVINDIVSTVFQSQLFKHYPYYKRKHITSSNTSLTITDDVVCNDLKPTFDTHLSTGVPAIIKNLRYYEQTVYGLTMSYQYSVFEERFKGTLIRKYTKGIGDGYAEYLTVSGAVDANNLLTSGMYPINKNNTSNIPDLNCSTYGMEVIYINGSVLRQRLIGMDPGSKSIVAERFIYMAGGTTKTITDWKIVSIDMIDGTEYTGFKSVGCSYFNAVAGKPVWWDGTQWVDATGTPLE